MTTREDMRLVARWEIPPTRFWAELRHTDDTHQLFGPGKTEYVPLNGATDAQAIEVAQASLEETLAILLERDWDKLPLAYRMAMVYRTV